MNDAFFDKLKQRNISADIEKTKVRVGEIWDNAEKKQRKELIGFTGATMYHNISKIRENGRITARMAILLARYLDVNPFYLIGETDERESFSDDFLKNFLTKLGYKELWREYKRYIKTTSEADETESVQEAAAESSAGKSELTDEEKRKVEIQFDSFAKDVLEKAAAKYDMENEAPASAFAISHDDISAEQRNVMNNLTEDEMVTLMRALMIRAKMKSADTTDVVNQLKLLLLLH